MIRTVLKIEGMACGMCEAHINDAIRRDFKTKKVASNHRKGESVILSEDSMDEEKLKRTIADTGYTLISVASEHYVKKGVFGVKKHEE